MVDGGEQSAYFLGGEDVADVNEGEVSGALSVE